MQTTADQATLELREAAIPEPGPQQVLVQMRAASLNRGEFIIGHGLQKAGTAKAIGMEGAGEIVKLGAGVASLKLGQRVMGRCTGAFAEYALMDFREVGRRRRHPGNLCDMVALLVDYDRLSCKLMSLEFCSPRFTSPTARQSRMRRNRIDSRTH